MKTTVLAMCLAMTTAAALAQSGPRSMSATDIEMLRTAADADMNRFLDTYGGKAVFTDQGRFVEFKKLPLPTPTWAAMVALDRTDQWASCVFDHPDAQTAVIQRNARVRIVGWSHSRSKAA